MINRRSSSISPTKESQLSDSEIRGITSELVTIFAELQRKRIAHRNIKPANIVIVSDPLRRGNVRICNFELAAELPQNAD